MDGTLNRLATCPSWCTAAHGTYADELNDLHTGDDVPLAAALTARLCCSVDSHSGVVDGPYIVVGSEEWSPQRTAEIGEALMALARQAGSQVCD